MTAAQTGRGGDQDDQRVGEFARRTRWPAARYLPQVVVVTALVVAIPVTVAWLLRARGIVSSPVACVAIAAALSIVSAYAGSAYWRRRQSAGDLLFSELLVWGWMRRLRIERRVAGVAALLRPDADADALSPAARDERRRLLIELTGALEAQDPYTAGHSRRVARHAELIARRMGVRGDELTRLVAAAAVHDVGKLYVPLAVLHKPGRLDDDEFAVVKRHAADGAAMVAPLGDGELTAIVRHHHERFDGNGYPAGLHGDQIPLGARIVAVADTFDAIIEARSYRGAATHQRALDVLAEGAGTQFDPRVVGAFASGYGRRRSVLPWVGAGAIGSTVAAARPRLTQGGRAYSLATVAALALLAALAGGRGQPGLQQPAHLREGADLGGRSVAVARPPRVVRTAGHLPPTSPATPPTPTCEAYSTQLCVILRGQSVARSGAGAAARTGSGAGSLQGASTRGLPFTG